MDQILIKPQQCMRSLVKVLCLSALLGLISLQTSAQANSKQAELREQATQDNAVVLLYHHVSESTPASTSVSPDIFKQHMQLLKQNYQVLPLNEVVSALKQGKPLPKKAVAITFDDGHDNLYQHAYPILKALGLPYTVFITPATQGRRNQLSWEQIAEMAKHKALFANHSMAHQHYLQKIKGETQEQWLDRISQDIQAAENKIEQYLGYSLKYLAYPYGEFDQALAQRVEEMGFTGFGQHSGAIYSKSPFSSLPRFPAAGPYAKLSSLKTKLNSLAMPVTATSIQTPLLAKDALTPLWRFTLDTRDLKTSRMNCFYNGKQLELKTEQNTVTPSLPEVLPFGRSRVNCTVPSQSQKGRFYWYSQPWFKTNPDGIWRY